MQLHSVWCDSASSDMEINKKRASAWCYSHHKSKGRYKIISIWRKRIYHFPSSGMKSSWMLLNDTGHIFFHRWPFQKIIRGHSRSEAFLKKKIISREDSWNRSSVFILSTNVFQHVTWPTLSRHLQKPPKGDFYNEINEKWTMKNEQAHLDV